MAWCVADDAKLSTCAPLQALVRANNEYELNDGLVSRRR